MKSRARLIVTVSLFLIVGLATAAAQASLPPAEAVALERLTKFPRHGERVTIEAAGGDRFDAWVVYPERPDKAPDGKECGRSRRTRRAAFVPSTGSDDCHDACAIPVEVAGR